jgi:hypothetical protein
MHSPFWRWRHARPFWGGLFVLLSGVEIFLTVRAPLPVVVHVGMQGFIGYLLPILIALLGVLLIFNPAQHVFYALVAAVLSLASWITSNLGGFVIGLLLGLVGSALAFAWSPDKHRHPAPASAPAELQPAELQTAELLPAELQTAELLPAEPQTAELVPAELQSEDVDMPGVQPETSHSLPRHRRPDPGLLSGE